MLERIPVVVIQFDALEAGLRFPVFFSAPHRVMFGAGCIQSVVAMLLWAGDLGGRFGGLWSAPAWPVAPVAIHAVLMLYGTLAYFVFGFLFTAGPRWQGQGELKFIEYVPAFLLMALGWIGFYVTLALGTGMAWALGGVLAGWLAICVQLLRIVRRPCLDRRHISAEFLAVFLGMLGLASALMGFATGDYRAQVVATQLGLWGFLLPAFFTVEHRMLPVFAAMAAPGRRLTSPDWALWCVWPVALVHGLGDGFGAWPALSQWRWLVDLPFAALCVTLSHRWAFRQALRHPMVAVLHGGFAWLAIACSLYGIQSLAELAGYRVLGLGPLHAITIGYFMSTLVGMASRVIRGHSGRPVVADRWMLAAWWGVQAAALTRIGGEWFPVFGLANPYLLASLIWLLAVGSWALRYGPLCWLPRADGRPG